MSRIDARTDHTPRAVEVTWHVQNYPEASLIYRAGGTSVLIAVSLEEGTRDFLRGTGQGWITAEYAMHPRSNPKRQKRDRDRGKPDGRGQEIQRLIGRSLRAAIDLKRLGERTITIDCDVLSADGGTRTACITGGWIGLAYAIENLRRKSLVGAGLLGQPIAAVSVGALQGRILTDLCFAEDSKADIDLNVVATQQGHVVEVQGTAEGAPIARPLFDQLLDAAFVGLNPLFEAQQKALEAAGVSLKGLIA